MTTALSSLARFRAMAGRLIGRDRASAPPADDTPMLENTRRFASYADKARAAGLDTLFLYLTFDCDTDEDAKAALELDPWLRSRGIRASYAVPGAQLRRSADIYRHLKAAGATFMNHGGRPHASWRDGRFIPMTFYDKLTTGEVADDIRTGHEIVSAVLGDAPKGFRAPHFGSFQAPDQLALIYRTARELGYQYCSTTIPQTALDKGPIIDRGGVFEIPLFGSYFAPTTILDSWTYLEDRKDYRLGSIYFDLFSETVEHMLANDQPGVLAYYADPAHVIGQAPFLAAMDLVAENRIRSVTAEELVAQSRRPDAGGSLPNAPGIAP